MHPAMKFAKLILMSALLAVVLYVILAMPGLLCDQASVIPLHRQAGTQH